jgi:predicted cupin superfamily sugar epimerase
MLTAQQIIDFLAMKPLPNEGGFYIETYRAHKKIPKDPLPTGYPDARSLSTAILYLLTPRTFSALHRLKSDEIFHFYLGDAVTMLQLHPNGKSEVITLGKDLLSGQRVQTVVPAGSWQGCILNQGGRFALMGTTVTPGFEFEDFEQPDNMQALIDRYPEHKQLIIKLTHRKSD